LEGDNIMNNEVNWMQQGWECPKCGAVMSPTTACCVNCRGNKGSGVTTSITDGNPINKIQEEYHLPSSICSTGPSESVVYGKEDPEEQWERYQLNV
jgi:hypothetical protein